MNKLNRSLQPEIIIPTTGKTPEHVVHHLGGGVPVYLFGAGTLDLLRIEFVFNAGQLVESVNLAATTANAMLTEGTTLHDAMTLNELIDITGAVFTHTADKDAASLVVITLPRKLREVTALAEEVLFHPSFPDREFGMIIDRRIQSFLTNRQKTAVIAREEFYRALYGGDNPYGRVTVLEDYRNITPDLTRAFHSEHYRRSNMYITVSGKEPERALEYLEDHFSCINGEKWQIKNVPELLFAAAPPGRMFFEVEGSVQSAVRLGWRGITREHHDYQALQVANMVLGGYFGSRLMRNIREDKGFTYGISSVAGALHKAGFITIVTEVANEYREQTIKEIVSEINDLRQNEISMGELNLVRNHFMGEIARMFDGPFTTAETVRGLIDYDIPFDYFIKLEETVRTITPRKIKELFNTYYDTENAIEIIAGAR